MFDIRSLLEYNEEIRHQYFECFIKLSWKEFAKNREASFYSIKNILVHTIGAIEYWLDFLQGQNLCSRKDYNDYRTFEQVKTYMEKVEKRMHEYLNTLPKEGLNKEYTTKNDYGKKVKVTAEDVLVHVFEEEIHHRGEFIALLWQMGVEPPMMGWKGL